MKLTKYFAIAFAATLLLTTTSISQASSYKLIDGNWVEVHNGSDDNDNGRDDNDNDNGRDDNDNDNGRDDNDNDNGRDDNDNDNGRDDNDNDNGRDDD